MSSDFCEILMSIKTSVTPTATAIDRLARKRSVKSNMRRYRPISISAHLATVHSNLPSAGEQKPSKNRLATMTSYTDFPKAAVVLCCLTKSSLRSLTLALVAEELSIKVAILILLRRLT
jgi:hypothetical protein